MSISIAIWLWRANPQCTQQVLECYSELQVAQRAGVLFQQEIVYSYLKHIQRNHRVSSSQTSKPSTPALEPAHDAGFALVAVILVGIVVATIALGLLTAVRMLAGQTRDLAADAISQAAIEAGLNRMLLAYMSANDPLRAALVPDGRMIEWEFQGRKIRLRVQAESGKLDLNAADLRHVSTLLKKLFDSNRAHRIFSRIDEARLANKFLRSTIEVLSPFDRMSHVRDVFQDYFTVMTAQRGVDFMTTPMLVLRTMPDLPPEGLERIIVLRNRDESGKAPILPQEVMARFGSQQPIYTFSSEASEMFERPTALRVVATISETAKVIVHVREPISTQQLQPAIDR